MSEEQAAYVVSWQRPDIAYPLAAFAIAVKSMAQSSALLPARLGHAWVTHLRHLTAKDFPIDLAGRFAELQDRVMMTGTIAETVMNMTDSEAEDITAMLVELYSNLLEAM